MKIHRSCRSTLSYYGMQVLHTNQHRKIRDQWNIRHFLILHQWHVLSVHQHIQQQRVKWFNHLTRLPVNHLALRTYTWRWFGNRAKGQLFTGWITLYGLSSNSHRSSSVSISPHKYQRCQRTMKKRRGSIAWWLVCLTAEQVSGCRPAQTCGWINSPCNICEGISIWFIGDVKLRWKEKARFHLYIHCQSSFYLYIYVQHIHTHTQCTSLPQAC